MKTIEVGIIGATGYAGVELLRLMTTHPYGRVAAVSSVSFEGKPISEVYPNLCGVCDDTLENEDAVIEKSEVIFAAMPHGLSEPLARKCVDAGKKFIDLGADFRLTSEEEYKQWYGLPYKDPELHKKAVYCIPELHRELVKDKEIIANPGCYPTSIALGLAPAVKEGIVRLQSIIIDSKSGVTGSGRGLSQTTHYPDCNEAFSPYKIASHRHTPEIEQTLAGLAGEPAQITFVPHLLPVNRGIVSTIYVDLKKKMGLEEIHRRYQEFYKDERFVRVMEPGQVANLRNVKFSNYCDISLHVDERTGRLIVVSAIDNMVKGAAGQAIQNMNLLCGIDESAGLKMIPPAF